MRKAYVECNPDKTLFRFLVDKIGIRDIKIFHPGGKSRVIKQIVENSGSIGLIDEDPWSYAPKIMSEMKAFVSDNRLRIRVYKHKNNSQLIELIPRLEDWILDLCDKSNIDSQKYNLPRDPDVLHKIINQKIDKFETLLKDLQQNSMIFKEFINMIKNILV